MRIHNRNGVGRILALTLLAVSLVFAWSLTPALAQNNRSIKVMQQNMDSGTDLGFIFGDPDPVEGANLTLQELTMSSMIPQRAQRLADEIAAAKPDLISLQEVTLWATGPFGEPETLYDQLQLLQDALAARNAPYDVVDVQALTQAFAPLEYDFSNFIYFTDRDVILVRSDAKHAGLVVSKPANNQVIYSVLLSFGGFTEYLGYMYVDVDFNGAKARYFNTHLESPTPAIEGIDRVAIQEAQGLELITALNASEVPVILVGDFNADASPLQLGPDITDTVTNITAEDYVDVWQALHNAPDYGLTWPRYLEDVLPILTTQRLFSPTERIDLIFEKGLTPINIEMTRRMNPPIASDHMGVIATLRFSK